MKKKNKENTSWMYKIPDDFMGYMLLSKFESSDSWMYIAHSENKEDIIKEMREKAEELGDIEYLVYEVNEIIKVSDLNVDNRELNLIPLFVGGVHKHK